ncbi:uncharacterized protein JCM15063_000491 [Sporobolomyces koalae]|uniref:uncharacterized protein n=1 Tax=Sporobolomyces koalae TaxID=500713 RepID=UPI00317AF42F
MLVLLPLALTGAFALLHTTVLALPTSEAPTCAIRCFQKKVEEGDYLAPGAKGLHGLCSTPEWVKAYNNCIEDNCKESFFEEAYLFGVNVCTGQYPTSVYKGDTSSARKLSTSCQGDCPSSSSSASASATLSSHVSACTCTETSHSPDATQILVGTSVSSSQPASITSSVPSTATASAQMQPSATAVCLFLASSQGWHSAHITAYQTSDATRLVAGSSTALIVLMAALVY